MSENSDSSEEDEVLERGVDAAVREHSYLPGTSNPLFPASLLQQRRRQEQEGSRRKDHDSSTLQELAILELDEVVLFPGSTLPLRLRHAPWIEYLGRMIDDSRGNPNVEVRIGIVTHVRAVDRRRMSPLRMAFTTVGGQRQNAGLLLVRVNVDTMDDDDDDHDEEENEETSEEDEQSAEYHELMDEDEAGHYREEAEPGVPSSEGDSEALAEDISQASPGERDMEETEHSVLEQQELRQHEEEQKDEQETIEDEVTQQQNDHTDTRVQSVSPLRYDVHIIEENLSQIDQSLNDALDVLDGIHEHEIEHRHLLNISRRLDRAEVAQRPIVQAFDNILDMIRSGARLSNPDFVELLRAARQHRLRVAEQLDRMQSIHFRLRHLTEQRDSQPNDPLIGRIGTMATVSYTFDDDTDILDVGNGDAPRNEDRDELVITVLGTNRFRIISRVGGDEDNGALNRQRRLFGGHHDMSETRFYNVEELPDWELPLPPLSIRTQRPMRLVEEADQRYFHHVKQVMEKVSNVSCIPGIALKTVWPWRLVGLICTALDRISVFDGLTKNLPALNEDSPLLEPTVFSFWIASNMSLSQQEKLDLLNMPSTVERLRFILQHVLEQEGNETYVCCKSCRTRLSNASEMFTVGGAEGTTGAYVNEYGIIHQTITLRNAEESKLAYSGGPETRDSWFPGYSWTITYCQRCHSHLGWKFHLVRSAAATEDRPEFFFGWSASSVTFISYS